ncbi:MAG: dethiobiotin synthase [Candidatus Muproteobacteria bacterium RBG_16_64_11]|uniref:ATP-dependent dethiobiotin synthetase BioD n=1 Tax=Candidatus Muproteobacteria bacterium RBG_16_64_11 TaxID=1817758 RepID=A0A1F6TCR8_9PROT|nr:MAG: dethiobiotin synthase [Candidatus Muproteobacteria bacterium RBG_16_64_11]
MNQAWFVTGTDTNVGKTLVSCALLRALRARDLSAVGMKPVASGCHSTVDGMRHGDAEALMAASSVVVDYAAVNPYALRAATAPHLAAQAEGVTISIDTIAAEFARVQALADAVVVEGVGGWAVPIDATHTMADVAARLRLPVVLVVGIRLGCLNHALLTAAAIQHAGCRLAGWVANHLSNDADGVVEGYVTALRERLPAPLIGGIPYMDTHPDAMWRALDLDISTLLEE